MNTQQLIDSLSTDVPRVTRYALAQRVGIGIASGGLMTLALVIVALGIRPDLQASMHDISFWTKCAYTITLGIGASCAVTRLGRPIPGSLRGLWPLTVPALILSAIAVGELIRIPSDEWPALWLGQSWIICPCLILTLAAPIFVGLLWTFRKLAPIRLRAAGAVTGLTAGTWAATLYCLHCRESAAVFVLTWYSLGILLAAAIGAVLGPRLLRW
jgi:hypothetical protein